MRMNLLDLENCNQIEVREVFREIAFKVKSGDLADTLILSTVVPTVHAALLDGRGKVELTACLDRDVYLMGYPVFRNASPQTVDRSRFETQIESLFTKIIRETYGIQPVRRKGCSGLWISANRVLRVEWEPEASGSLPGHGLRWLLNLTFFNKRELLPYSDDIKCTVNHFFVSAFGYDRKAGLFQTHQIT